MRWICCCPTRPWACCAGSGRTPPPCGLWSAAATDATFLTTLGAIQASGATFDTQPTQISDTLVKLTYYGDVFLSGAVNGSDYHQVDLGLGTRATGWANGDFNYDSVVDGSDYALIDNTVNQFAARGAVPIFRSSSSLRPTISDPWRRVVGTHNASSS